MTVYHDKRGNGRWRYSFMWRGQRYTGSCPPRANSQRNAERLEKRRQDELIAGRKRSAPTVAELHEEFIAYQAGRVAQLTLESQKYHLEHVLLVVGRRRVDEIDKAALDAIATEWLKSAAPRTVNVRMGTFLRMLALAKEWKHIPEVPKYTPVKVPKDTPRFLTDDEAERLLKAATDTPWYTMILIGLRTGLRIGELRGLQWGDVNLDAAMLHVRRTDPGRPDLSPNAPKGKKERTVPLTPEAHAALTAAKPAGATPRDWVWPALLYKDKSARRNRSRSQSGCKHGLEAAVITSGIDNPEHDRIGWHTLRHTFASWLVIRGVSLRVVQELLGHASIKQTDRYAHLAPNATHHAEVARLDLALVGADRKMLTEGDP